MPAPLALSPGGPRLGALRQGKLLGGAGFVRTDAWRCMDRCRKIGKQMTVQPFGASMPLASFWLRLLGGPLLAVSRQRLSLGGRGKRIR